jgi:hypothetical protein
MECIIIFSSHFGGGGGQLPPLPSPIDALESKFMRILALKCTYYIIYRVVRDSSSLITLNKQTYPGDPKFLLSAYNQTTNKPYGYISLRYTRGFALSHRYFSHEITVYLPVNSKKVISCNHDTEETT